MNKFDTEVATRREQFLEGFRLGTFHATHGHGYQVPQDATERFALGYKYGHDEFELERQFNEKAVS